jgi:hypothetical protein
MPVASVMAMLGDGMTEAEILVEHPELESDDLAACVEYAAGEAEDNSSGFDVKVWLAETDDLPTLDIGIEAAALVRQDRVEGGG